MSLSNETPLLKASVPTMFPELFKLLQEVHDASKNGMPRDVALQLILKSRHYWPALQWKKFFDHSGLVLLHNTYKRTDVEAFQDLYNECRSVVLDLNAPLEENIVVSLASAIPERVSDAQYETFMNPNDICEECFEGTVVSVYKHKDDWHFGTSACPTVDSSRYHHPKKSHGDMFDDALANLFPLITKDKELYPTKKDFRAALRSEFVKHLNPEKAYAFLLVHHENGHIMKYTQLGLDYATLFHISSRERATLAPDVEDIHVTQPLAHLGVRYAQRFADPSAALKWVRDTTSVFGFIARRENGVMYKVSMSKVIVSEEQNLGNPNPWMNMLWVYMSNKPHYKINDYIAQYAPEFKIPKDVKGNDMAPVYIIHTVICTMRDILYECYCRTTKYYTAHERYKMDKDIDAQLSPIMRFHLAQLRHIQTSTHKHAYLTPFAIYHYLCHHQTMKNMRILIHYFATQNVFQMNSRTAEAFSHLDAALSE
jgi:hypothetical protein